MRAFAARITAAAAVAFALVACGEKPTPPEAPPPPQAEPAPTATPAPIAPPTPTATPTPTSTSTATARPGGESVRPEPVEGRTGTTATPAPPATPPPTAAAHPKVGADKCKMCHRLQHQSWAASPHAAKGLDCEGCHGNGGDYWPAGVMRDRAKAVAAGLVTPTLASCGRCHADADAALFAKVHAHKAR